MQAPPIRPDELVSIPEFPPTPEAPPKKKPNHTWKIVAGGVVAIVIVAGIGQAQTKAPATPAKTACINVAVSQAATTQAGADFQQVVTDAGNLDQSAIVDDLRAAVVQVRIAETATAADPAIAGPLASAAFLYEQAANHVESGELTQATSEMTQATTEIDAATTAVQATSVPAC
jgi:hypothetical protein